MNIVWMHQLAKPVLRAFSSTALLNVRCVQKDATHVLTLQIVKFALIPTLLSLAHVLYVKVVLQAAICVHQQELALIVCRGITCRQETAYLVLMISLAVKHVYPPLTAHLVQFTTNLTQEIMIVLFVQICTMTARPVSQVNVSNAKKALTWILVYAIHAKMLTQAAFTVILIPYALHA